MPQHDLDGLSADNDLFIDPMLGTPLSLYIEKDVPDRDSLVDLIQKHGGTICPAYSSVPYILVDPLSASGQSLYRQYASKKGKIILDARWVHECIKSGELQTYQTNWAGCKVQGNELQTGCAPAESTVQPQATPSAPPAPPPPPPPPPPQQQHLHVDEVARQLSVSATLHPQVLQAPHIHVDQLVHAHFPYTFFPLPQPWPANQGIAPQQTHVVPPPIIHRPIYRETAWDTYAQPSEPLVAAHPTHYDYRYREDHNAWGSTYYDAYDQSYQPYIQQEPAPAPEPTTAPAPPDPVVVEDPEPPLTDILTDTPEKRGRKRTRTQPSPNKSSATPLVPNRNPRARSPTPPTRIVKSTYGGNLFTVEDIMYLKKYIDYCHDQGLTLSLREICERVAVKAPHHTFYSWRRYCNKHQIKLDGYVMRQEEQLIHEQDMDVDDPTQPLVGGNAIVAGRNRARAYIGHRNRSPTPPRALFRSTTGKGVAFTEEDVAFLIRFMDYRTNNTQGPMDMVAFWKEVATKAPHHSRASWMKFWRRHKHELNRTDGDDPLPRPPEKKMRYSDEDDILLAKYFFSKPEGTSDQIFQAFGRLHSHHPWKGWQEHHRIHKVKIDHLIERLGLGEDIENDPEPG